MYLFVFYVYKNQIHISIYLGSHFIWTVPYRLSTDAQIINKLCVETLLTGIWG